VAPLPLSRFFASPPCHVRSCCRALFLFLLPPCPPRSTLFPYTTLFRSSRRPCRGPGPRGPEPQSARSRPPEASHRDDRADCGSGDRKSTRLNSSHVEISYAVFCLKKKKTVCSHDWHSGAAGQPSPARPT